MREVALAEFVSDKSYISQAALYAYKCGGMQGYHDYRAKEFKPTAASRLGNAVHLLALQPQHSCLIVDDLVDVNKRTKAGREAYATFLGSLQSEEIPLCANDRLKANELAERLAEHIQTGSEDRKEKRFFAALNGLPVKLAPDLFADDYVADIKTSSLDLSQWVGILKEKAVWQLAFYAAGMRMKADAVGYIFWLSTTIPQFHLMTIDANEMQKNRANVALVARQFKAESGL